MTNAEKKPDLSRLKILREERDSRSPRARKIVVGLLAVACIAFYLLAGIFIPSNEDRDSDISPRAEVREPSPTGQLKAAAGSLLSASGYVVAQRQAAVSSKATGRLKELLVKEGDAVAAGQVIAVLENEDLVQLVEKQKAALAAMQTRVQFAEAERNVAQLDLKRIDALVPKGAASAAERETADARFRRSLADLAMQKANVVFSEAALKESQVNLEYSIIRAPFAGTVLTKTADIGEIVAPFGSSTDARAAVVTIADMASLQVEADVSEANISKVTKGQPCKIVLDSFPEKNYGGVVDSIVPTVDRAKATVMVKIRFLDKDERVIPEMSAKVEFEPFSGKS